MTQKRGPRGPHTPGARILRDAGVTVSRVADEAKCSSPYVSMMLNGTRPLAKRVEVAMRVVAGDAVADRVIAAIEPTPA